MLLPTYVQIYSKANFKNNFTVITSQYETKSQNCIKQLENTYFPVFSALSAEGGSFPGAKRQREALDDSGY
jgi:hypothetical protein